MPTLAAALARYNATPAGQNSSPTLRASFPHSGTDLGQLHQPRFNNIPAGWPRTQTDGARRESTNNQEHLVKLLMDKVNIIDSELTSLKNEQKQMIKTTDQLQKREKNFKEKNIYCWHCRLYTGAVHFCTKNREWIHLDRFNRIILYAATEKGAIPTHPNDIVDGDGVIRMKFFEIDRRETILNKEKEEEAERKQQEQKTQGLSQLMGIIFGESANLKICNELNEHLDKFQHLDNFHNSNAWSDVKKFLDYHSTTGHPHADYPKGTLTSEQIRNFNY